MKMVGDNIPKNLVNHVNPVKTNLMAKKIAVDFGTSNTVIAVWNEDQEKVIIERFPGISHKYPHPHNTFVIPSVIYFEENGDFHIGKVAAEKGKQDGKHLMTSMKRYIANKYEIPKKMYTRTVTYFEAGTCFLERLLECIKAKYPEEIYQFRITAPVEAFESYQKWLADILATSGIEDYKIYDEATACTLGYMRHCKPGEIYMVVDFGGGSLDVSIVQIRGSSEPALILGKAGELIGGEDIDEWLYEDYLQRQGLNPFVVRDKRQIIQSTLEEVKIQLSTTEEASVKISDTDMEATYTRTDLEQIMERKKLCEIIKNVIRAALDGTKMRGVERKAIQQVLLCGGTSSIPYVKTCIEEIFLGKVKSYRVFDAVANGACLGFQIEDRICHDYAIKYFNKTNNRDEYLNIVESGTLYPVDFCSKPLQIDGVISGQKAVRIDIYERISEIKRKYMFVTQDGEVLLKTGTTSSFAPHQLKGLWLNEESPTIVELYPPCKGDLQKRLHITFSIDEKRRLCITVYDNFIQEPLMEKQPVVYLKAN